LCKIERASPIRLALTGCCAEVLASKEIINFTSSVRQKDIKDLMVINKTDACWNLRPIIEGDYWSGTDVLVVPAQTTQPYTVTYFPLAMTTCDEKHMVILLQIFTVATWIICSHKRTFDVIYIHANCCAHYLA
jgi:hydrocephalus-inducing protein